MLEDLLKSRKCFKLVCGAGNKCFKLVCGAGNEDAEEVEKLVTIYSLAGCSFFDLCANPKIVDAAKRGLKRAGIEDNRYICVSVGIAGDPHITKAVIDQEKCVKCGKCKVLCPHDAIIELDKYKVKKERCIGCSKCADNCPKNAIDMVSEIKNYDEILPEIIAKGIDCIEFHAISTDDFDVMDKWKQINDLFDGMLCISLDRSVLGDKKLKERVWKMLECRKPYTTIVQADGIAMSGNNDEYGTTLQAVATAQLFQNANMPVYIMMSGGTNKKSMELAALCDVYPHCLAVGSFARKIVKDYLIADDLFENPQKMAEAVDIAKSLVEIVVKD